MSRSYRRGQDTPAYPPSLEIFPEPHQISSSVRVFFNTSLLLSADTHRGHHKQSHGTGECVRWDVLTRVWLFFGSPTAETEGGELGGSVVLWAGVVLLRSIAAARSLSDVLLEKAARRVFGNYLSVTCLTPQLLSQPLCYMDEVAVNV